MGCYPFGKMMSKVFAKRSGEYEWRPRSTVYSPPPSYYYYGNSVARSVNFSNDNPVIIVPPDPTPGPTVSKHHVETVIAPSADAEIAQEKDPGPARSNPHPYPPEPVHPGSDRHAQTVRIGTGPDAQGPPKSKRSTKAAKRKEKAKVRFAVEPDIHGPNQMGPNRNEPRTVPPSPINPYRYVASPLVRWDDGERRREYFGGEYHYYPTPIREGIYSIATDSNRLTAMFSEENPNACTIV